MNPASRCDGTFLARTSMSLRSHRWNTGLSVLAKGCAAITMSAKRAWPHGPIGKTKNQVGHINDMVSFEPDIVTVHLDAVQLQLAPGQTVIPHGPDCNLDLPIA